MAIPIQGIPQIPQGDIEGFLGLNPDARRGGLANDPDLAGAMGGEGLGI